MKFELQIIHQDLRFLDEKNTERARPKRMRLSKIIKELNKENAPPDGWKPGDKVPSSQA